LRLFRAANAPKRLRYAVNGRIPFLLDLRERPFEGL
jgi:hypothetical protein